MEKFVFISSVHKCHVYQDDVWKSLIGEQQVDEQGV